MEGEEKQTLAFAPTYYQAESNPAEAQRVRVDVGQEVTSVDFALTPGRAAMVSGTVVTSQGLPLAGESVSLSLGLSGRRFRAFRFLPARRRSLTAASRSRICRRATTSSTCGCRRRRIGPTEFAMFPIAVTGVDLDGIVPDHRCRRRSLGNRHR